MSILNSSIADSISLRQNILSDSKFLNSVDEAINHLIKIIENGGTIYSCGNGGSACDAMHFTEELVARYKKERPGIRAHHLMDPGTLTCWANDYSWDKVFERQAQTFCTPKDALVVFSTSGNSENILRGINAAKEKGAYVLGLLGKGGGKAAPLCDSALVVPSNATERIQEIHITLVHIFCEEIEARAKLY
jgi:D-sedoheptulose 7-phosphate isomerase